MPRAAGRPSGGRWALPCAGTPRVDNFASLPRRGVGGWGGWKSGGWKSGGWKSGGWVGGWVGWGVGGGGKGWVLGGWGGVSLSNLGTSDPPKVTLWQNTGFPGWLLKTKLNQWIPDLFLTEL